MGAKGYRNTAKSGVKAAAARRRQSVAKARTRKPPRPQGTPRRPKIEIEERAEGSASPHDDSAGS